MTDILTIELLDEDVLEVDVVVEDTLTIQLYSEDVFSIELLNDSGKSGPWDYNTEVYNRPSINGEELIGDKSFEQLGRDDIKNRQIKDIIDEQYELIFGGNH